MNEVEYAALKRGSSYALTTVCEGYDDLAIDLTGWVCSADLKTRAKGDVLTAFGVDSSDAAQGTLVFTLTPAQTLGLPANNTLQWDIKFESPGGGDVHYSETIYLKTSKHITD